MSCIQTNYIKLKDMKKSGFCCIAESIDLEIDYCRDNYSDFKIYDENKDEFVYFTGISIDVERESIVVNWDYIDENGKRQDGTDAYPFYRYDNCELFDCIVEECRELQDNAEVKDLILFE